MYEDLKWFSQILFSYKDTLYQTDGVIRLSVGTSSKGENYFNSPHLGVSISSSMTKSCNMTIQVASDLVMSFKRAFENLNSTPDKEAQIIKRVNRNTELMFSFKLDMNNNSVVEVIIRSNASDFIKTILPHNIFLVFAKRISSFVNNYDQICYSLLLKNIDKEEREIIQRLPGLIKGISSQIVSDQNLDVTRNSNSHISTNSEGNSSASVNSVGSSGAAQDDHHDDTTLLEDLDKFIGGERMENIVVPEIKTNEDVIQKKSQENFTEVKSIFVDKVIQRDLTNLENILVVADNSPKPIYEFKSEILKLANTDLNLLPGLDPNQEKSLYYVSKLLCSVLLQTHIRFNNPLPVATPILKYRTNDYSQENVELALDLFVFTGYVKLLRNRLSEKIADFINNKSRFYLHMRCYVDAFVFTFLDKVDVKTIKSLIINRYKYYKSIGVFSKYEESLKVYNCPEITDYDIDAFVFTICEKIIGKGEYIIEQHRNLIMSNNYILPTNNDLNLEQIINELIPLEIKQKLEDKITPEDLSKVSNEVKSYFTKKKRKSKEKQKSVIRESNIIRFIKSFRDEIPDAHREEFFEWLKTLNNKNFNKDECPFPLQEFGDNIIKGLYTWTPKDDQKLTKNYKYFYELIENCKLEKGDILVLEKKNDDSSWDNVFA